MATGITAEDPDLRRLVDVLVESWCNYSQGTRRALLAIVDETASAG